MPEILSSTFVLAVNDLAASKRFYLEKLGFREDFSVDGWAFLILLVVFILLQMGAAIRIRHDRRLKQRALADRRQAPRSGTDRRWLARPHGR